MGSNGQNATISEHGHVTYHKCSNIVANIMPADPPSPRQKIKIQLFQNNIMLHIKLKGNTNAATWSQIFCLQTTLIPSPGVKVKMSKNQLYQNTVMLHIKLKGIMNATTWLQIFCPQTPHAPDPRGMGSIAQKSTFSEYSHVAY